VSLVIKRAFVKSHRYWLSIALVLVVTGCSSSSTSSSSADNIKVEIEQILPGCKFETVDVPNGVLQNNSKGFWEAWLLGNEIQKRELVFELDSQGQEDYSKPSTGDKYFNDDEDEFFACHSLGKSVKSIRSYEDVIGKNLPSGGFCWAPNPDLVDENLRRLKACEERVEEISKLGFWVVLRLAKDSEKLQQDILSIAETNFKYKYSIAPVLVSDGIAVTLAGNFDQFNDATISNVDLVWKEIVDKTKLSPLSSFVPGYPDKFNLDDFPGRSADSGDRKDIASGYERVSSYQACKSDLKTSELNYVIGDCGRLNFEILQADLNTGECTFLGYWKDAQGVRRIGVVTFCDVFTQGSFSEGSNYEIGVRINGVTSYKTRLGYENSVLSFTAVR